MAARFYTQVGEEFIKALYTDQKPTPTRERRQMSDWLARGTQPICLNCREDDVRSLVKDGFKILEIFELSGVPGTINGSPWLLSLANKAPHPKLPRFFPTGSSPRKDWKSTPAVTARRRCARILMNPTLTLEIFPRRVSNISTIRIGNGLLRAGTNRERRFGNYSRRAERVVRIAQDVQFVTISA
jgi:hypothetical protein